VGFSLGASLMMLEINQPVEAFSAIISLSPSNLEVS
jgi:hypothetical protein